MNLLNQTTEILNKYGLIEKDILWVGTLDGAKVTSWQEFCKISNMEFIESFLHLSPIIENLCIVGIDWWLERRLEGPYSWWIYKTMPKQNKRATRLLRVAWK